MEGRFTIRGFGDSHWARPAIGKHGSLLRPGLLGRPWHTSVFGRGRSDPVPLL